MKCLVQSIGRWGPVRYTWVEFTEYVRPTDRWVYARLASREAAHILPYIDGCMFYVQYRHRFHPARVAGDILMIVTEGEV